MTALLRVCLQTALVGHVVKLVMPAYPTDANLLENYLPASMQALAYYIDLIQYDPISSTTIEPPFFAEGEEHEKRTTPMPTTTARPTRQKTTSSWFQSPAWWSSTTTTTAKPLPTHKHKPGLYAPYSADMLYSNHENKGKTPSLTLAQTPNAPFDSDSEFINWLKKQKPRQNNIDEELVVNSTLDLLPLSLVWDISKEPTEQDSNPPVINLDNFLRNYDDGYGTAILKSHLTGKKRIPPTKPYVDFLLIYDLLKRDAKAANLSKFEGYTDKMIRDLNELSKASPQRQMYTLLQKLLDRKEIQRSDVVTRAQKLMKELGDGNSVISKSLMFFPPLQFLP